MKIQELIAKYKEEGKTDIEIANHLEISQPMVSQYKKSFNVSLSVARTVYAKDNVILYPFSEEAVKDRD